MPLASVAEWRVRIGSCWCALGRPFKTSKSSGNYRSFAAFSGGAMLPAVYALMAMVLALTRDAAVVFVRGAESINGCVNKCQTQIKNNVRPRGVLIMLILLLQAATFIQSSLLLRCGDIESNPGPGIYPDLDYDVINNDTVLIEDDFREVYREIISIQSNYYQFGIELGLPLREMDAIQRAFRQDIPQAFTEVLKVFLNHRYNIEKYGPPTWRKLVEAVDNPAGGNSHALAKKIAEHHPVDKGGGNDQPQVTKYHSLLAPEETPIGETTNAMVDTSAKRQKDENIEEIDVERNSSDSETSSCSPEQPSVVHEPEEPQYIYISSGEESITEEEDIHQQDKRLDQVLSDGNLGKIADSMYEWEGPIAEQLELSPADVAAIKMKYQGELKLQTRAALRKWKQCQGSSATYNNLIKVFERAGYNDYVLCVMTNAPTDADNSSGNLNHTPPPSAQLSPSPIFSSPQFTTTSTVVPLEDQRGSRALVQRCCETMAAYYRRQVDDRAWPPVKSTNFVNLALIGDQTSWRETVQKSVDEIIEDKTTASYLSMVGNDCIGTLTLLEGRPGSGKTVLMNKISCDWEKGEILKSSLLIFIPLRRLREEPDRKLATLLRVACSALPQSDIDELASHINKTQGKGIVFAFDGFDEYVPYKRKVVMRTPSSRRWYDIFRCIWRRQHNRTEPPTEWVEDVFELLKGETLTKSTIFVTSRPVACNEFRRYATKRIEVLGFLQPQVIEYVNYYFSTDKAKARQLVAHLEHHPNLMHMAYLPLHCAMLAFLYEHGTFLPETETEFYKHFTLSTLLRSLCRQQGTITTTIASFDQLPQREKTTFDKVCQLAFNATVKSKQVFTSADIESILPGTDSGHARKDVSDLGLIVTDRYFMRYGLDDTYTFLHLTFQEYLGAIYIAKLSESKRMQIIQKYKNQNNLSVVWRFLCGMMDFSQTNAMVTFENIMKAIKNKLEKLQCCFETQHSSPCSYIINAFNGQLEFSSNNFTPSDCAAIGYTISKSDFQSMICLIFDKCSFSTEGALNMLQKIGDHPLSLTVSNCPSISVILDRFSKRHIPDLQVLNLSSNRIGDTTAQALADSFKHCINMKKLILSDNSIGAAGMEALAEGIKHCPMERLNFGSNHIGNAGAQALAGCLKHWANMKELNLSDNNIHDAGMEALAEGIKCCAIEKLIFRNNHFGSVGARALAGCLKHCTNVKELDLSRNRLSDDAVPHLIEIIQTFKNLEKLSLEHNYFTGGEAYKIELATTRRNEVTGCIDSVTIINI